MDDVAQARPEILKAVDTMMKKGKFSVPGPLSCRIYLLTCLINEVVQDTRRSLATCLWYKASSHLCILDKNAIAVNGLDNPDHAFRQCDESSVMLSRILRVVVEHCVAVRFKLKFKAWLADRWPGSWAGAKVELDLYRTTLVAVTVISV